jgi:hypothetical protein
VPDVAGHEHQLSRQGDRGDPQIRLVKALALALELSPQRAAYLGGVGVEWQDHRSQAEDLPDAAR